MEKVSIRPTTTDILIEPSLSNELNEVFSYNYGSLNGSDEAVRRLGSLFLVGQIQPKNEDTSYVLNLIAGLAKREYYLPANDNPKDAFSKTLKKINEALDDFFKDKDLKVNIGIFAIAGENMHISKLGKFKILLARGNEIIDVLNNISLFNKESEKETKFSSVITGKVCPEDNILAYYPSRSAVSREKIIRAELMVSTGEKMVETLKGFKEKSDKFELSGIHLTIVKYKEPAIVKRPQPAELRPKAVQLASSKIVPVSASPVGEKESKKDGLSQTIQVEVDPQPETSNSNIDISSEEEKETQAAPLIIPSEFGMTKKANVFSHAAKSARNLIDGISGIRRSGFLKQIAVFATGLALMAGVAYGAKTLFFNNSNEVNSSSVLTEAETNIKLAKTKISQNELAQARQILSGSLLTILGLSTQNENTIVVKNEIVSVLDEIDKSIEVSPGLVFGFDPTVYGNGIKLAITDGAIAAVATDTGKMVTKSGEEQEGSINLDVSSVTKLYGSENRILLTNISGRTLSIVDPGSGTVKTHLDVNYPEQTVDAYLYSSNLYLMTRDGVFRMIDAGASSNAQFTKWFSDTTNLPPSPMVMAVDGDIYVLDKSGTLAKYFKGEKESEEKVDLIPDEDTEMLTVVDNPNLFVINKKIGRIYVVSKEGGTINKVLKVNNDTPILDFAISGSGTLYFLTSDNRVWKFDI